MRGRNTSIAGMMHALSVAVWPDIHRLAPGSVRGCNGLGPLVHVGNGEEKSKQRVLSVHPNKLFIRVSKNQKNCGDLTPISLLLDDTETVQAACNSQNQVSQTRWIKCSGDGLVYSPLRI